MVDSSDKTPLISIVDDDVSVRIAMANLVRSLGFAACSFDCAEDYLRSGERHQTRCIVSDIQMPGTSGLELQSLLAAQNDHTPIIFITAFPKPHIRRQSLDAGAICFLTKPFDGDTLIKCIEEALNGGRADHRCC